MEFDVATLVATLKADIAGFQRNMAAVDANLAATREQIASTERSVDDLKRALGGIDPDAGRFTAGISTMKGAVVSFTDTAKDAGAAARDITVSDLAMAKTAAYTQLVKDLRDALVEADIASRGGGRAGGTGGGGGRGFFAGILPGGQRAGAGAITAGIGLGLAAGPALGPAALGVGALLPSAMESLVGVAGTLKLAFADLTSAAFTTQKGFDALSPIQQKFVTDLRSLDAGLVTRLEGIAQQGVIPGLTSALGAAVTPASVNTMTSAVREFSAAISAAAGAWGKLLGSTQFNAAFGPVLRSAATGAKDFFVGLSNIFDALIHLQQAAIPFVSWVQQGLLAFSQWVDTSVKAAQSSGQLAHVFAEAKVSLQALGGLVASIAGAVHSLLDAFGGFNTAIGVINTLSHAFDTIGSFLNQNRAVLADVFKGLVTSINDAITAIGVLSKALRPLLVLIDAVAKDFGGWRVVIDAVGALFVAKMILNVTWVSNLVKSLGLVGPAAAAGATEAEGALAGLGAAASAALVPVSALLSALAAGYLYYKFLTSHQPAAGGPGQGLVEPTKGGPIYAIGGGRVSGLNYPGAQAAAAARLGVTLSSVPLPHGVGTDTAGMANIGPPATFGISPYGTPTPLTQTGAGTSTLPGVTGAQTTLAQAQAAYLQGTASGSTPQQQATAAKDYLIVLRQQQTVLDHLSGTAKQNLSVERERLTITRQILAAQKELASATVNSQAERILGLGPGGVPTVPGVQGLQFRERTVLLQELERLQGGRRANFGVTAQNLGISASRLESESPAALLKQIKDSGYHFSSATLESLQKINEVLHLAEKHGAQLASDVRTNVSDRLKEISDTLKSGGVGIGTNYMLPSVTSLAERIPGLSPQQRLVAEALFAGQQGRHGRVPTGGAAAGYALPSGAGLGYGTATINIHGPIHITSSATNLAQLERDLRQHALKTARRNTTQTRGPNAGKNWGGT